MTYQLKCHMGSLLHPSCLIYIYLVQSKLTLEQNMLMFSSNMDMLYMSSDQERQWVHRALFKSVHAGHNSGIMISASKPCHHDLYGSISCMNLIGASWSPRNLTHVARFYSTGWRDVNDFVVKLSSYAPKSSLAWGMLQAYISKAFRFSNSTLKCSRPFWSFS